MDDLPVEAEQDAFYLKKYKELRDCVEEFFHACDAVEARVIEQSTIESSMLALQRLAGVEQRLHWLIGCTPPSLPVFAVGDRFRLLHGERTAIVVEVSTDAYSVVIDSGTEDVGKIMWLSSHYLALCTLFPRGSRT